MLRYVLLFIIVFSYFLWLNPGANFSDPDSFYHAKTVELIQEQGIIKEFKWLPFTTLNNIYIDHHLLYHWLLTPFFYLGNSLAVLKIMTTVLAALAIVVFYWWLNQRRVRYSWFYVLSLLSAHQFVFRLNLAKIPAISLIFLLIFSHYLFKHQNKWSWPLFIISWLYVWLYGGWPIMLGIGIIYYLADVCLEGVGDGKKQKLTEIGGNLKKDRKGVG